MLGVVVAAAFVLLAGVTASVAFWVHRVGRGRAATVFIVVLGINTVWLLAAGASVLANTATTLAVMLTVRAITAMWSGLGFFVFALYYTGRTNWLRAPVRALLVAFGAVTVIGPISNPWTGLTARELELVSEPITHAEVVLGPLSLPMFVISTLLSVTGLALVGNLFLRSQRATRAQAGLLSAAVVVPVVLTSGQLLDIFPYPMIPYGPFGVGLLSVCVGVAMFRNQLFAAEPVARSSIVEQIGDPILVVGSREAVIDYNQAADRVFGPLTIGETVESQLPALADSDGYEGEVTVETEAGERIYSLEPSELEITDGQTAEALVFREITDRKQYEQQLEQIASTISHDLRSPLSVATGNVELALETDDTERLETARDSLERMDRIITDVLELSREGTRVIDPERVDLERLAEDAWETTETESGTLVLETDGERIEADAERVRRLFENLFRNAVEHGSANTPSREQEDIGGGASEHGDEGLTIWVGLDDGLYVEDDGPGIPEDERDEVFEHGYTSESDNTGYGLDIVESIATAHDWTVAVEEGREGGAKFVFEGVQTVSEKTVDA